MAVVGVAVAFGSVIYLASKGVALWLSLLLGTGILGLLSQMGVEAFAGAVVSGLFDPMTVQLVAAVALISGLSKAMKENGDLELMVRSLVSLVPRPKALSMLLPALIGMINVPGGAVMSAPMVEENGRTLHTDAATQAAINLVFRHIGYFIYPLHTSMILLSELLALPKLSIIKYNLLPTLFAVLVAYLFLFRSPTSPHGLPQRQHSVGRHGRDFVRGFSSILLILGLVLIFDLPFYLAAAAGLLLALLRNAGGEPRGAALAVRLKRLVTVWIDYRLTLAILFLMLFKAVVEASGVTGTLAAVLVNYDIPLPILIIVLGALTSHILGAHLAASGLLAPFFAPLIPQAALAPYAALLLIAIMLGYLVSPLHLCLVLTNQYFAVPYNQVVKKMAVPLLALLAASTVQLLFVLL